MTKGLTRLTQTLEQNPSMRGVERTIGYIHRVLGELQHIKPRTKEGTRKTNAALRAGELIHDTESRLGISEWSR